jgi:hypothetical protein
MKERWRCSNVGVTIVVARLFVHPHISGLPGLKIVCIPPIPPCKPRELPLERDVLCLAHVIDNRSGLSSTDKLCQANRPRSGLCSFNKQNKALHPPEPAKMSVTGFGSWTARTTSLITLLLSHPSFCHAYKTSIWRSSSWIHHQYSLRSKLISIFPPCLNTARFVCLLLRAPHNRTDCIQACCTIAPKASPEYESKGEFVEYDGFKTCQLRLRCGKNLLLTQYNRQNRTFDSQKGHPGRLRHLRLQPSILARQ